MTEFSRTKRLMQIAANVAATSDEDDYKFGAVIAKSNKIISCAHNSSRTNPIIKWQNRNTKYHFGRLHAEARAIILAKTDLTRCSIYVFRRRKIGDAGDSFPCPQCLAMIKSAGISKIFFMYNKNLQILKI